MNNLFISRNAIIACALTLLPSTCLSETFEFTPDLSETTINYTLDKVNQVDLRDNDLRFKTVHKQAIRNTVSIKIDDDGWVPLSATARATIDSAKTAKELDFEICGFAITYLDDVNSANTDGLSENKNVIEIELLVEAALIRKAVSLDYINSSPTSSKQDLQLERFQMTPLSVALKTGLSSYWLPDRKNGLQSKVVEINDHLDELYKQGRLSVPHYVSVASGCGAGEVPVAITASVKIKSLTIISDYFFGLCQAEHDDPWSDSACRYWQSIEPNADSLSGAMHYRATLADGRSICGQFDIDRPPLAEDKMVRVRLADRSCRPQ